MDPLAPKKFDKNELTVHSSILWKLYDFMLLTTAVLFLDCQIKIRLGNQALFVSKLSYLAGHLKENLARGLWLESSLFLLALALITASILGLAQSTHIEFNGISRKVRVLKNFCLLSIAKREIPFEAAQEILILREDYKNKKHRLLVVENGGGKITLQKSPDLEKIKTLAKKIQAITHLPIRLQSPS